MLNESEPNGNIIPITSDASRTLALRDCSKRPIILLTPSQNECTLWGRKISEARKQFAKNEKNLLQRQRSSKSPCDYNCFYLSIKFLYVLCDIIYHCVEYIYFFLYMLI